MEDIKDRLAHILRSKNLTASQFAELMEIQPSNVSHLLNGRNKPSLDFLIKIKEVFPEYSFDWIIMGKKPITEIKFEEEENKPVIEFDDIEENDTESKEIQPKIVENQQEIVSKSDIKKVLVIYSDNTFEILKPRN